MSKNEELADLIKMIKYRSNMTQSEISAVLGVSKQYLSDTINGRYPLSDDLKKRIYEQFTYLQGDSSSDSSSDSAYLVPLLPISARGGSLNDFVTSVKDSDCERIVSPIRGADYALTVSGDSMAPEYPSGSQILVKRINERAFIDWGRVYVLDTCNGTVIKKLLPSESPDAVTCKSINPDYPPFNVAYEDIYGVYRVLMCMSLK